MKYKNWFLNRFVIDFSQLSRNPNPRRFSEISLKHFMQKLIHQSRYQISHKSMHSFKYENSFSVGNLRYNFPHTIVKIFRNNLQSHHFGWVDEEEKGIIDESWLIMIHLASNCSFTFSYIGRNINLIYFPFFLLFFLIQTMAKAILLWLLHNATVTLENKFLFQLIFLCSKRINSNISTKKKLMKNSK